jgi:ABC-type transporter Mla maintaining outer membrane lipid asymmetry ATPase subunit MlaF
MAINQLIRGMQSRLSVTSVVVTHDIQAARHVADRVAFLDEGVITFIGDMPAARRSGNQRLRAFLEGGGLQGE